MSADAAGGDDQPSSDAASPVMLTVVIPTFNAGHLLALQLESLAVQQFGQPWEVILADNGTTDGSLDGVVDRFAGRLDLRVVDASARRGPSFARNTGVAAARGEWLAFCDADDLTAPGWLAAFYAARESGDLIAGRYEVCQLNPPAQVDARGGAEHWSGMLHGPKDFLPFAGSANFFIHRRTYDEFGGFDESVGATCEDVDLSWRLQLAGRTIAFAADAVIHYRFRTSVRGVFRQARTYKLGEAVLYSRYRGAGMPPDPPRYFARRTWWAFSRAHYLVLNHDRRLLWAAIAGEVAGMYDGRSVRKAVPSPTSTPRNESAHRL